MADQPRKKAWEMTPDEFGRAFSPHRVYSENGVRFFYKAVDPSARPMSYATRDEAVRAAHRHVVAAALAAGVAVPPEVAALYPDIAAGEQLPDIAELTGPARNEATAAPERAAIAQATLAKCLTEAERERDRLVGAALLAHDDAKTLHRTVTLGLTKALNEQTEKARELTEAMRAGAEDRAATVERINETLADIARQQAKILAEARKPKPAKPKKWTFKVRRDNHGSIAALDAEQC
ncbi:MAG: hypothetical protein E6R10_07175 [Rhodocyclaceae bacterium]|nr:MAG: hypothetical protein E6R10_07175 [Rhodocyclaceae bacterium]